jgi:hypothetical protein
MAGVVAESGGELESGDPTGFLLLESPMQALPLGEECRIPVTLPGKIHHHEHQKRETNHENYHVRHLLAIRSREAAGAASRHLGEQGTCHVVWKLDTTLQLEAAQSIGRPKTAEKFGGDPGCLW